MKTRLLTSLIAFVLLALLGSCKKDEPDIDLGDIVFPCTSPATDAGTANGLLMGEWEWVNTITQGRGTDTSVENPQNTGENRLLEFKLGGLVVRKVIDGAEQNLRYEIRELSEGQLIINLFTPDNELESAYFLLVCQRTLILTDAQTSLSVTSTYRKQ
jgi:hypothetical protein